ncbi:MAG TPA: TonB-dependent receptor plug domain-containing protein, partial [Phenylobacterium sp.]
MTNRPSSAAARLLCASSLLALATTFAGAASARADEASPGPTELEQIVVTATKRPERSKDVPIALSAFGPADLATRDPRGIIDLATALPNVQLTSSGNTLFVDPVVRGISSSPRNAGVESGLAVYVDGVYTGRPETFDTGLEDARAVEVLRGPQGTLFGKNAIAGALSVTTQDPTPDVSGRLRLQVGSHSELRASGVVNVPLGETAGARLSLFRERRDGYVKNLFDGSTVGDDNYWGGRLKAKVELGPQLDLVLAADGRRDERHPYFGEIPSGVNPVSPLTPQPVVAPGPFTINEDHAPDRETRTLWGVSATLNYRTAGGATVSSI